MSGQRQLALRALAGVLRIRAACMAREEAPPHTRLPETLPVVLRYIGLLRFCTSAKTVVSSMCACRVSLHPESHGWVQTVRRVDSSNRRSGSRCSSRIVLVAAICLVPPSERLAINASAPTAFRRIVYHTRSSGVLCGVIPIRSM